MRYMFLLLGMFSNLDRMLDIMMIPLLKFWILLPNFKDCWLSYNTIY